MDDVDDARFDTWTRRRFGLVAGRFSAVMFGLLSPGTSAAKKRKHCKKNEKRCGKKCVKGTCCPGKPCQGSCICERTVEKQTFCAANGLVACVQCNSSAECDPGSRCIKFDCGAATAVCVLPCMS